MRVRRPILRQFAEMRNLFQRPSFRLLLFVLLADSFGNSGRVNAAGFRINLPKLRMLFDAFVELGLRDRGVVHFAVAVAAVADDVHDHVAAERGAVFRGDFAYAHDGIRVFPVQVKNGHGLTLGDVRSKARGMFLARRRGEADQIVHDDVNCPADRVRAQISQVQGFRPDALPGESGVTMHDDGNDFIESFLRAVDVRAAQAVARLLGARPANGDGVDSFEVAGIRNKVDADFFARGGDICARRADVIFHVPRAKHAARIHVFESRDYLDRKSTRL